VITACARFGRLNTCVVLPKADPAKGSYGFAAFETFEGYQAALAAKSLTLGARKAPIADSNTNRAAPP
jgi:hypothetical protein